ncbi:hypothetical protein BU16DRAFT_544645 [Lophium mytilinum]|uniref:Uncharacterized protein n=1 Tax=Lophium mytilinum TaxID=390894 RepID=A0A6A6QAT0_9PEZI|nr:hypothetical protein BU16DRAFT_544645 [Lophium mytilinum]
MPKELKATKQNKVTTTPYPRRQYALRSQTNRRPSSPELEETLQPKQASKPTPAKAKALQQRSRGLKSSRAPDKAPNSSAAATPSSGPTRQLKPKVEGTRKSSRLAGTEVVKKKAVVVEDTDTETSDEEPASSNEQSDDDSDGEVSDAMDVTQDTASLKARRRRSSPERPKPMLGWDHPDTIELVQAIAEMLKRPSCVHEARNIYASPRILAQLNVDKWKGRENLGPRTRRVYEAAKKVVLNAARATNVWSLLTSKPEPTSATGRQDNAKVSAKQAPKSSSFKRKDANPPANTSSESEDEDGLWPEIDTPQRMEDETGIYEYAESCLWFLKQVVSVGEQIDWTMRRWVNLRDNAEKFKKEIEAQQLPEYAGSRRLASYEECIKIMGFAYRQWSDISWKTYLESLKLEDKLKKHPEPPESENRVKLKDLLNKHEYASKIRAGEPSDRLKSIMDQAKKGTAKSTPILIEESEESDEDPEQFYPDSEQSDQDAASSPKAQGHGSDAEGSEEAMDLVEDGRAEREEELSSPTERQSADSEVDIYDDDMDDDNMDDVEDMPPEIASSTNSEAADNNSDEEPMEDVIETAADHIPIEDLSLEVAATSSSRSPTPSSTPNPAATTPPHPPSFLVTDAGVAMIASLAASPTEARTLLAEGGIPRRFFDYPSDFGTVFNNPNSRFRPWRGETLSGTRAYDIEAVIANRMRDKSPEWNGVKYVQPVWNKREGRWKAPGTKGL